MSDLNCKFAHFFGCIVRHAAQPATVMAHQCTSHTCSSQHFGSSQSPDPHMLHKGWHEQQKTHIFYEFLYIISDDGVSSPIYNVANSKRTPLFIRNKRALCMYTWCYSKCTRPKRCSLQKSASPSWELRAVRLYSVNFVNKQYSVNLKDNSSNAPTSRSRL